VRPALERVRSTAVKTHEDEETLQNSLYGTELKRVPHILTITNLMIHGVEAPDTISRDNALARPLSDYTAGDKVDLIVANPPFGASVQDGIEQNFPTAHCPEKASKRPSNGNSSRNAISIPSSACRPVSSNRTRA